MKFLSQKSIFFRILVLGSVSFLMVFPTLGIILGWIEKQDVWIGIPCVGISSLLLWIYFGTHYRLTSTELIYRSGPLKGKIRIDEIREIVVGKTLYIGIKPATAGSGLIIKFGKYDEIYISPDSNDSFIEEIRKHNLNIRISE